MVIHNLNFVGVRLLPGEAEPELIVDTDRVLASAVTFQRFERIAGQTKISQSPGLVQLKQFAQRYSC